MLIYSVVNNTICQCSFWWVIMIKHALLFFRTMDYSETLILLCLIYKCLLTNINRTSVEFKNDCTKQYVVDKYSSDNWKTNCWPYFFFFFNSPREQKAKKVKDRGVEIGKWYTSRRVTFDWRVSQCVPHISLAVIALNNWIREIMFCAILWCINWCFSQGFSNLGEPIQDHGYFSLNRLL